jgi:hypothetical protein
VLQAVRSKTWKFITANPGNPRGLAPEELYDLGQDPKETKNVSGERAGDREEMRAALGRASIKAKEHAGGGAQTEVDRATKDRLKALGYAE